MHRQQGRPPGAELNNSMQKGWPSLCTAQIRHPWMDGWMRALMQVQLFCKFVLVISSLVVAGTQGLGDAMTTPCHFTTSPHAYAVTSPPHMHSPVPGNGSIQESSRVEGSTALVSSVTCSRRDSRKPPPCHRGRNAGSNEAGKNSRKVQQQSRPSYALPCSFLNGEHRTQTIVGSWLP